MVNLEQFEVWFKTGRQHLYVQETLRQVACHSEKITKELDACTKIPVQVIFKPVKTPVEIYRLFQEVNAVKNCEGIIAWMQKFYRQLI